MVPAVTPTSHPSGFDATWEKNFMAMHDICKKGLNHMSAENNKKWAEGNLMEQTTKDLAIYTKNSALPRESIILRKMKCVQDAQYKE